jgi:hypothetical protein
MGLAKRLAVCTAFGLGAVFGARAADLSARHAQPIGYVGVCEAHGAGFFYIPGTSTCLRVGGQVRAEYTYRGNAPISNPIVWGYNLAGVVYPRDFANWRGQIVIGLDARTTTEFGTLRTFVRLKETQDTRGAPPLAGGTTILPTGIHAMTGVLQGFGNPYETVDRAFVEFAGLTAGRQESFFDFDAQSYEIISNSVANSDERANLLAYTLKLVNGVTATVSAEDRADRIIDDTTADTLQNRPTTTKAAFQTYAPEPIPDLVGNLNIDQSWGQAQVSGAYHLVDSVPVRLASGAVVTPKAKDGFAGLLGVKFRLPWLAADDSVTVQGSFQQGAMAYVNAVSSYGGLIGIFSHDLVIGVPQNDAFILPDGSIGLSKAWGLYGAVRHYCMPSLYSSLFAAYMKVENPVAAQLFNRIGDNADVWQLGLNAMWSPITSFQIGGEVLYSNMRLSGAFPLATAPPFPTPAETSDWRGRLTLRRAF